MKLYIIIGIYYILMSLMEQLLPENRRKRAIWVIFSLLPMFVLTAFRGVSVGTDTIQYYRCYVAVFTGLASLGDTMFRMEPGYVFANCLCNDLGFTYLEFQIFVSFLIYSALFVLLRRFAKNMHFACFLIYSYRVMFSIMNVSRSWIATAIFILIAIPLLIKKKSVLYYAVVVLDAALFHTSVLVCIFLYPLVYTKITKRKLLFCCFAAIALTIIGKPIFDIGVNFFDRYKGFMSAFGATGIAVYMRLFLHSAFLVVGIWAGIPQSVLAEDARQLGVKSLQFSEKKTICNKILFCAMILLICIDIIGLNMNAVNRVSLHFDPLFVMFATNAVWSQKTLLSGRMVWASVTACMVLYFYIILLYRPEWNAVVPYVFYNS